MLGAIVANAFYRAAKGKEATRFLRQIQNSVLMQQQARPRTSFSFGSDGSACYTDTIDSSADEADDSDLFDFVVDSGGTKALATSQLFDGSQSSVSASSRSRTSTSPTRKINFNRLLSEDIDIEDRLEQGKQG